MTTAILYASRHHGNTKKLAEALSAIDREAVLIDAASASAPDLSGYDRIGIASGIYAGSFDKALLALLQKSLPEGKPVFLVYTSAMPSEKLAGSALKIAEAKHCPVLGTFSCRGYNTFGPFKLVGGTAKGHPDEKDLAAVQQFYRSLPEKK